MVLVHCLVELNIWWTSSVEQYGSNHNSLRENCKFYIFSHKNKMTKCAELSRYYLCNCFVRSQMVVLRCCGQWREEFMECMIWIVQSLAEQPVVGLVQQLLRIRQIRRALAITFTTSQELNASTRLRSVAVAKPLHSGEAYISLGHHYSSEDSLPAGRCRSYIDCALSLITRWMCSDADKWLLSVTPRTLRV